MRFKLDYDVKGMGSELWTQEVGTFVTARRGYVSYVLRIEHDFVGCLVYRYFERI